MRKLTVLFSLLLCLPALAVTVDIPEGAAFTDFVGSTPDPGQTKPATFVNQIVVPALDSEDNACGPIDTWDCWGVCRAAGPWAAGGNVMSLLVAVDCERTGGGSKTCGCHWQPRGIGLGGVGLPFHPSQPCVMCSGGLY